jgi:hypothetical protein
MICNVLQMVTLGVDCELCFSVFACKHLARNFNFVQVQILDFK